MTLNELDARLRDIEARLERLERLAFSGFSEIREVANYAYRNVRLEVGPEEVRRLPRMEKLQDRDALRVGMAPIDLYTMKMMHARGFAYQMRRDVLTIAKELAEAFRRDAVTGRTSCASSNRPASTSATGESITDASAKAP